MRRCSPHRRRPAGWRGESELDGRLFERQSDQRIQGVVGGDGSGEKSCGSVTSCQITGLKNGKTYSFKVQAKNEVGWSKESNGVEGTPDKLPDAPTDVKAEASKNTITVTWKALEGNFSAVDKYQATLSGRMWRIRPGSHWHQHHVQIRRQCDHRRRILYRHGQGA